MTARPHANTLDTQADDLRTMLADLARTHSHREQLYRPKAAGGNLAHFTKVPPLLAQLQSANPTSEAGARSGTAYESRPAASLEALDTLVRIDLEASRWVRDMGEDDAGTTVAVVKQLGGLLPSAHRCPRKGPKVDRQARKVTCCTWHAVAYDVQSWWAQARIVTGWDLPAWRPNNTCPQCGVRRSLRIRLAERIGMCVECRETWSASSDPGYQVLADHIRLESELAGTRVRLPRGPCVCVWPGEAPSGLVALCPRCGTATCRYAVRSAGDSPAGRG